MNIPFISPLITAVGNYFNEGQKIRAAKQERADVLREKTLDAKIDAIKNGQQADIEKDTNFKAGWMDDFSFFVFMIPAILAFFPDMVPHVTAGFEALDKMPLWYQYSLGGMLVAVWGYRRLVTPIVEVVVKQWVSRIPKL